MKLTKRLQLCYLLEVFLKAVRCLMYEKPESIVFWLTFVQEFLKKKKFSVTILQVNQGYIQRGLIPKKPNRRGVRYGESR